MTNRPISMLSYSVVMGLLVALTLVLVLLGEWYWKLGISTLYFLAIPLALAVAYLAWYRTLPYEPKPSPAGAGPVPAPTPDDDEPFEDPVEEADRLDEEEEEEGRTPEEPPDAAEDELTPQPPVSPK
ncbi:MAG: hypothetical protein ABR888_05365 [Thermoplasmata archaeon]|jgi:hypothetical protein